MPGNLDYYLIAIAALMVASVVASKASDRWGVPALLLFLAIGMVTGPEGLGIEFGDPVRANAISIIALVLILFGGGLDTRWGDIRPVLAPGLALSTVAVVITAILVGAATVLILDVSWQVAFLIGTTIASTDAPAIFGILRRKGIGLQGNLRPLLELESASNDPMGVFLTVAALALVMGEVTSIGEIVLMLIWQFAVGLCVGIVAGRLLPQLLNRLRLGYDGLYAVFTTAAALLVYGLTAAVGGSGFLAVYVAGVLLTRHDFVHRHSLIRFHDGLAWLAQIALFLTLGLLVQPSQVFPVGGYALGIALAFIVLARPVAVFLTLAPFKGFSIRQKAFVSWVGLSGAGAIMQATYPLVAGAAQSSLIFNVVFFVVLLTVVVEGTLLLPVARLLKVEAPLIERPSYPIEYVGGRGLKNAFVELEVPAGSFADGNAIVELDLPPELLVILIARDDEFQVPNGASVLRAGDRLLVLSEPAALQRSMAHTGMIRVSES